MCVPRRIFPAGEVGGAEAKTEAELLGRWPVLWRKLRRSYWGGGLGWSESRSRVTGEVGWSGEKAEKELPGRSVGIWEKAEEELLGRWAGLE